MAPRRGTTTVPRPSAATRTVSPDRKIFLGELKRLAQNPPDGSESIFGRHLRCPESVKTAALLKLALGSSRIGSRQNKRALPVPPALLLPLV
jgi:hypothetical protein